LGCRLAPASTLPSPTPSTAVPALSPIFSRPAPDARHEEDRMQADTPTQEQLEMKLATLGLTADQALLQALLPVYAGLISGAARIAAIDLAEREPSMTFRHPHERKESGA
jgi:hypothetical protein